MLQRNMIKDENLAKAEDLKQKAERIYKENFSKKPSFTRTQGLGVSIQLMKNAANHFRLVKDWKNAANAFLKAAEFEKTIGSTACSTYNEAAMMQMKYDKLAAVKTLKLRVEALSAQDKVNWAIDAMKQIGEIYEGEKEYLLAAENYNEIFELYKKIDVLTTPLCRFDLLLKAAELKVVAEPSRMHIIEAIGVYENVISKYVKVGQNIEKIYLRMILLHLANGGADGMDEIVQKFLSLDFRLKKSKAQESVEFLIKAFKEKDFYKFSFGYWGYWNTQREKPLELWSEKVLERIQEKMIQRGEDKSCS